MSCAQIRFTNRIQSTLKSEQSTFESVFCDKVSAKILPGTGFSKCPRNFSDPKSII